MEQRRAQWAEDDEREWFERWFASELYLELYSHRDSNEAEQCIELIVGTTGLDPTERTLDVLDIASGPGRHAIALARRGFRVTGVDLSPTLLAHSRHEALAAGVHIELIESDMRLIDFVDRFDLAVQLFTSFGYFDDPEDDQRVLRHVRRALHVGGWYALDLINERHLRASLVPRNTRVIEGIQLTEERWIEGDRVHKRIAVHEAHPREFTESVRLFSPEQIELLLRTCGLEPAAWFGDYAGEPFDCELSRRMLIVARAV